MLPLITLDKSIKKTLLWANGILKKLMKDRLPAFVLVELFSNSLVYADEKLNDEISNKELSKPKEEEALLKPSKKYLGNYERKIIVLVNDSDNIFLSDENLEFLSGILNACKLNIAHIALINSNDNPVDFFHLKQEMQPEYLLLFGLNALQVQLPFNMPHCQLQQYDSCGIVTAPSLAELNQRTQKAKAEKIKLWSSLQKMFSLEK